MESCLLTSEATLGEIKERCMLTSIVISGTDVTVCKNTVY